MKKKKKKRLYFLLIRSTESEESSRETHKTAIHIYRSYSSHSEIKSAPGKNVHVSVDTHKYLHTFQIHMPVFTGRRTHTHMHTLTYTLEYSQMHAH